MANLGATPGAHGRTIRYWHRYRVVDAGPGVVIAKYLSDADSDHHTNVNNDTHSD